MIAFQVFLSPLVQLVKFIDYIISFLRDLINMSLAKKPVVFYFLQILRDVIRYLLYKPDFFMGIYTTKENLYDDMCKIMMIF